MNIFAGELNNLILTMGGKVFFDYIFYMETYQGRDKFIRATSYLACLVGHKLKAKNPSLENVSLWRTVLRLFDLHYSFKKQVCGCVITKSFVLIYLVAYFPYLEST